MKTKPTLLASSPTLDGISAMISRFYCGSAHTLTPDGDVLAIHRADGVRLSTQVRLVKGRYRFESPTPTP